MRLCSRSGFERFAWIGVWAVVLAAVRGGDARAQEAVPADRAEHLRFDPAAKTWVDVPAPAPGSPAGDLAEVRRHFDQGRFKRARKALVHWRKAHGASGALADRALLLEVRIEKALHNYDRANDLLERFRSEHPGSGLSAEAAAEWFNIAEIYLSGVRRKFWGFRILSARDTALDILDRISTDFAGTSLGELSLKTKADYFFSRGEFILAEFEYARLIREYPQSRYRRFAMKRSADAALASFGGVDFDDAPLVEADERYRAYLAEYPEPAKQDGVALILRGIREQRALKEFEIGRYYLRVDHPEAAKFYFESVIENWPDTAAAVRAGRILGADAENAEVRESAAAAGAGAARVGAPVDSGGGGRVGWASGGEDRAS